MIEKVRSFGGEIVEPGPAGLVAAFGLETVEDAPGHAALAALAILTAAERAKSDDGEAPRREDRSAVDHALVSRPQGAGTIELDSKRRAWHILETLARVAQPGTIVVRRSSAVSRAPVRAHTGVDHRASAVPSGA